MSKTVFILVGPKGSGKTYIGTLIERKLKVPFFRVEKLWLSFGEINFSEEFIRQGFDVVEKEIDKRLIGVNGLIIESTASFDYFYTFLTNLRSRYQVKLVRLQAPRHLCMERIGSRDQAKQVQVSEQMISEMHERLRR